MGGQTKKDDDDDDRLFCGRRFTSRIRKKSLKLGLRSLQVSSQRFPTGRGQGRPVVVQRTARQRQRVTAASSFQGWLETVELRVQVLSARQSPCVGCV